MPKGLAANGRKVCRFVSASSYFCRLMKNVVFIISLCFLLIFDGFGQENTLDPVTISASLTKQRTTTTGRNILIIRNDQIKDLPANSLDELLKYMPGIEVQARGPMGSQSDFVLRGSTFQQVLVIIDGLRVNDPNTGHFNSYIPIVPAEIAYIEILKGASSAIFGADAVGGVVYIVTKSFSKKSGENETSSHLKGSAGAFGYLNSEGGLNYTTDKLRINGGFLVNQATGYPQRGTTGFFDNKTISLSAGYQINDYWEVNLRTAFDRRDFSAQNFYTTFVSDTASEKVSGNWNQLRIAYQKDNQRLSLDAGYKSVNDHYTYSPHSPQNETNSKLFQALLLYQAKISESSSLISGVNYHLKKIRSNDRGDHNKFSAAPFIGLTKNIRNEIFIHPSVQVVFFEEQRAQLIPQLDLSYTKKRWLLRGSIGKTIREADFTELYNNYNKPVVTSGRIGNPYLEPEVSLSYEIGASIFVNDEIKIATTLFQRNQRNVIDYVVTPYAEMPRKENLVATGTYALAKNIASVHTRGIESDVEYHKKINLKRSVFATLGFVGLHSEMPAGTESFYISSHAKLLANFSVVFESGNLTLGLNGLYKTRQPQEESAIKAEVSSDYFILNAKIGYAFFHSSFTVFAEAANLFNTNYSDLLGAPMPGRWITGGVRYQFSKISKKE